MEAILVLLGIVYLLCPIIALLIALGARRQVLDLQKEVRELRARWAQGEPAPAAMQPPMPAAQREEIAIEVPGIAAVPPPAEPAVEPSPAPAAEEAPQPTPQPRPPGMVQTWLARAREWLLGGNLVAKAGLLILFIGVSFLLKYAAAHVTVPIELRLAGVALADIGLLVWGWRIRERRAAIALPVQGAALAILMMVTFAAFKMYQLLPAGLAFGLLFALTGFTCLLAVLQDALWLALFGIAGGFAAPILTSTGQGSHIALFSYYALLNAGVLAIALKRSWRVLNLVGFAFTFLIGTAWGVLQYKPEHYLSAQAFLLLFFAFYVGIALVYALREAPRLQHYVDGTLVFGTPLVAFGLQAGLVRHTQLGLALSALALGMFYMLLTAILWRRRGTGLRLLVEAFFALAVVFGTLAIPFALDGRWTSAAWALEGAGIVWIGLRQRRPLAWAFGLLVQAGACVSFLLAYGEFLPATVRHANLFAGPFLGALLIGCGTAFSAWVFQRQAQEAGGPRLLLLARGLLAWCGFWWFGWILHTLAGWGATHLLLWNGRPQSDRFDLWVSTYAVGLALSGPMWALLARRLRWDDLRWSGAANWLALGLASIDLVGALYLDDTLPKAEVWIATLALWLSGEWLMMAWQRAGWALRAAALKLLHAVRTIAPWLMIWPVGRHWIASWLYGGSAAEREMLEQAGWFTSGSWARYLPAWAMMAAIAWLMRQSRAERWPTLPLAAWYRTRLIPAACGWALLLVAYWNLTQNGAMAPLPYLPLLNPLDLSTGLALLLAVAAYRLARADLAPAAQPWMARLPLAAGVAAYLWFNLMLLRTAAHFLGIRYQFDALFGSQFVQAMLALVWSATALLLMRRAVRQAGRQQWMLGAALLGLVVLKLFLVDLSGVGGVARIISFVGVGLLMLAIGYVAPYPSQRAAASEPV
jgi:uncharacterized membrane protein